MVYSHVERNEKRAHWAKIAAKGFAAQTGQYEEAERLHEEGCFKQVVADLICNLAHLAHSYGHDFEKVYSTGMEFFEGERKDVESEMEDLLNA